MSQRKLSNAQDDELAEIAQKHEGAITREQLLAVIEERGEKSPLYEIVFDCSNKEATRRYRLERCRWILRHARFSFRAVGNPEPLLTRRVLAMRHSEDEVFVLTERATRQKRYREQLEAECRSRLSQWRQKWTAVLGWEFVEQTLHEEVGREEAAE